MTVIAPPSASLKQGRVITPPAAFPWPWATHQFTVFGSQGRFSTDLNPRSLVNAGIWSSTNFIHVDVVSGNDTTAAVVTNPGDTSKPAQSISKAILLGNATNAPYRVLVKAGTYTRLTSIHGNGGGTYPSQPCSLEAWGGRVVHAIWQTGLTWTADATFTSCYGQSRTNVLRVFDTTKLNSYGDYTELTVAASAAACNSTAGTWFQNGATLLVHRADGAAVTDSNTRSYLGGGLMNLQLPLSGAGNGLDMYVSGFDFEGGASGALYSAAQVARNFVAEDCTFKYSGSVASPIDCVQMLDMEGIAAFFRCGTSAATKDGFNFHWFRVDKVAALYPLTVDCWGRDNGRGTSTSNNGWTAHEGIIGIDVNGQYTGNYGGTVHIIGGAKLWCVGTVAEYSLGDTAAGGFIPSVGFVVGQTDGFASKMWLDSTLSRGNIRSLWVHDPLAAIYTRGHRGSGGAETVDAGGTLGSY